jgi:uncharacterized membrane-anchored protein YitT (DUF2179 family)
MKLRIHIENYIQILLGVLAAGMGIKGFLMSTRFIDGGVTGISMLVAKVASVPLPALIFVLNIPFVVLGYRQLGWSFAVRSAFAIIALAVCVATVNFPDVTHDKLLSAVFGGIFLGVGVGLAIRGGAVLDGTEIAALLLSRRLELFKVNDVILVFNVLIFTAALFFLGVESALYSILTYMAASKMIDFILNGIEQYTSITVISIKGDEIRAAITVMGRGVTVYEGKGGYGKDGHINSPRDIVFTVATRLEVPAIKQRILEIDPSAFIVQQSIEDTTGGLVRRKRHH